MLYTGTTLVSRSSAKGPDPSSTHPPQGDAHADDLIALAMRALAEARKTSVAASSVSINVTAILW